MHRRLNWYSLVGYKLQQISVTADDCARLSGHCERKKLVIVCIPADAGRCSGIVVPERQFYQLGEELVPSLRLTVPIEFGPIQTRYQFSEGLFRQQYVDALIQYGIQ